MTDEKGNEETGVKERALGLYAGPRRTYEIFCLVAEAPKSIRQIIEAVPGDDQLIRSIVQGMVEQDLIKRSGRGEVFELGVEGTRMKNSLGEIPSDAKAKAYLDAWGTQPPDGY